MRSSMKHDLCSPASLSFRGEVRRRLVEEERKGVSLLQHSQKKKLKNQWLQIREPLTILTQRLALQDAWVRAKSDSTCVLATCNLCEQSLHIKCVLREIPQMCFNQSVIQ